MTALRLAARWLGETFQGLRALGRLFNPLQWTSIHHLFGELLSGGLVVPPPESAQEWSPEREQSVQIWSVIQPDGDIQLKVRESVLKASDREKLLADHLGEVAAACTRIADAGRQFVAARFSVVLLSSAFLSWDLVEVVRGIASGLSLGQILGGVSWWTAVPSTAGLVLGLALRWVLAWLVRRKLAAISVDQSHFGADPDRLDRAGTTPGRSGFVNHPGSCF